MIIGKHNGQMVWKCEHGLYFYIPLSDTGGFGCDCGGFPQTTYFDFVDTKNLNEISDENIISQIGRELNPKERARQLITIMSLYVGGGNVKNGMDKLEDVKMTCVHLCNYVAREFLNGKNERYDYWTSVKKEVIQFEI